MKHRFLEFNSYNGADFRYLNFIVLYPADNHATLDKCTKIGLLNGYNRIVLTYLFSKTGPSPEHVLFTENNNSKFENDLNIVTVAKAADKVVLAWGGYGEHKDRGAEVVKLLAPVKDKLYYYGLTKSGQPCHPLKIKSNQEMLKYEC